MMFDTKKIAIDRLTSSIQEAYRFIKKAETARERFIIGDESTYHSSSFASAKRASMDLSKSLVNLRLSLYEEDKNI